MSPSPVLPGSISVVIPALNEQSELPETLRRLRAIPEIREVTVVDAGSTDGTKDIAAQSGCRVITSVPGRGTQLRLGAQKAGGEVVLLLHADTWLEPGAGRAILAALQKPGVVGGGCWKVFRNPSPLLYGSRFKCAWRLFFSRRVAGDQAMFIRREVLEKIGGVPDVPLMEEFELCRRLRAVGKLVLARTKVSTSARRFQKHGVLRTYARMWRVMLQYYWGTPPEELKRIYERP